MSEGYEQHVDGDRYHKELGFPENVELPTGIMMLYSTKHAREEAQHDQFGSFDLPTRQDLTEEMYEKDPKEAIGGERYAVQTEDLEENGFSSEEKAETWAEENLDTEDFEITQEREYQDTETHVFEITVKDGEVKFLAMRKHIDEERDKILVIEPDDEHTITAWSNLKTDLHENLNEDIYVEP